MILKTLFFLLLVSALAVVTLRLAARLGMGRIRRPDHPPRLEVLEELALGPRQAVVALRAGDRVIIVARNASGFSALSELPLSAWEAAEPAVSAGGEVLESETTARAKSFAQVLAGEGLAGEGGS